MKIAVASDNWINVDRHLEEDGQFIILQSIKGKLDFDGVRVMRWKEDEIFFVLADCDVILCRYAEKNTIEFVENNGIKVIQTKGPIMGIINEYLNCSILNKIIDKRNKERDKVIRKIDKVRQ